MQKLLPLLFLFFTVTIAGQEIVTLRGQILNDSIEKTSLTVVNLNLKKGAITNESGSFEIEVRVFDTINISAVQYESRQFVVTQKIHERREVSLYLIPKVNELNEIHLTNRILARNLEEAANDPKLKESLEVIKDVAGKGLLPDLQKKTIEERRLHTATTGVNGKGGVGITGFIIPLPLLINSINGKTKRLKKHIAIAEYQRQIEGALNRFPDSMLVSFLKISEDQLSDFMFYALRNENELEAIDIHNPILFLDYLHRKSIAYKALREKEMLIKNKEKE